jgi:hypothetical protein
MCVPLQWFALLHLTLPASLLADALPLSLSLMEDALSPWSLAASLADALLLSMWWPPCGCFAVGGVFLVDALPPWSFGSLVDALPLWSLGSLANAFAVVVAVCSLPGWMLCHHGLVFCVGNHCVLFRKHSGRSRVLRAVALSLYLYCSHVYPGYSLLF